MTYCPVANNSSRTIGHFLAGKRSQIPIVDIMHRLVPAYPSEAQEKGVLFGNPFT